MILTGQPKRELNYKCSWIQDCRVMTTIMSCTAQT